MATVSIGKRCTANAADVHTGSGHVVAALWVLHPTWEVTVQLVKFTSDGDCRYPGPSLLCGLAID